MAKTEYRDHGAKNEACAGCIYSMILSVPQDGLWRACDYMGITGQRRPCEGGAKCTVKRTKEDKSDGLPGKG